MNIQLLYIKELIPIHYAYIDPGTGSMLFTILVGLISVLIYGSRSLLIKLRTSFGFNTDKDNEYRYVIYTDSKRYWNIFKSICDEFEKRKERIEYFTQSEDDPVFNEQYKYVFPEFIGEGNKAFSRLNFLKAEILLSTTPSLDVFQWKRSRDIKLYIHIPHACSDITLYRLFGIDYYNAILLSGDFQIQQVRKLEKLRNLPAKDLKVVGLTYFDELNKRLLARERIKNDVPVVLVAPSWGRSSILNKFGSELIDRLNETGYKIVIRPHPQSYVSEKKMIEDLMRKYSDIEWNRDNDNFDILNRADIMISDFSGVIFDFALVFNKPIIYADTSFDDSPYDCHWLDEELWTYSVLPKIGIELKQEDFVHIKDVIDDCMNNSSYEAERKKAIDDSWKEIGHAAENIVDYMIEKQKEINNGNE